MTKQGTAEDKVPEEDESLPNNDMLTCLKPREAKSEPPRQRRDHMRVTHFLPTTWQILHKYIHIHTSRIPARMMAMMRP